MSRDIGAPRFPLPGAVGSVLRLLIKLGFYEANMAYMYSGRTWDFCIIYDPLRKDRL